MRKKLQSDKKHLHLNLKKKWFDMIFEGVKKEEYRGFNSYWQERLVFFDENSKSKSFWERWKYKKFDSIIFSNGYAKDRRQFEVELKRINISTGVPSWGAEFGKEYFVLHLGEVIQANFKSELDV